MPPRLASATLALLLSMLSQIGAVGFGKQAAVSLPQFSVAAVLGSLPYALSLGCLALQAASWQLVLRRFSLSYAYFVMAGSLLGVLVLSATVFAETVTTGNLVGAGVIALGLGVLFWAREDAT